MTILNCIDHGLSHFSGMNEILVNVMQVLCLFLHVYMNTGVSIHHYLLCQLPLEEFIIRGSDDLSSISHGLTKPRYFFSLFIQFLFVSIYILPFHHTTPHFTSVLHLIMCHNYSIPLIHSSIYNSFSHLITFPYHFSPSQCGYLHMHSSVLSFLLLSSEVFVAYSLIFNDVLIFQKIITYTY